MRRHERQKSRPCDDRQATSRGRGDDAKTQAGHGNPKVLIPHGEAPGRSSVRPVATRAAALLYCTREWIPASAGMAKVTEWLVEPVGRRGWVLSSMTRPSSR